MRNDRERIIRAGRGTMHCLIAGAGAVTSVGSGVDNFFEALCSGRSGLSELRGFDSSRYRAQHAYEIDDRHGDDVPYRSTEWLLRAIEEAVRQADIGGDLSRVPVLVGTGLRELRSAELAWRGEGEFDVARLHFGTALRERFGRSEEHTSELQSRFDLVCRLLLEKKNQMAY